ncbi:MAG: class I SAM-dependent methyltransferase [Leptospirillia bacterium]
MANDQTSEQGFSRDQARDFYDGFGVRQDRQAWYESCGMNALAAHGGFGSARSVFELGVGTGRLAERLLSHYIPAHTQYLAVDLSATMAGLARTRLERFGERVRVKVSDGSLTIPLTDGEADRFISTYVLDLLSEADIHQVIGEARRILAPGGLLCLAGLTHGVSPVTRLSMALWRTAYRIRPKLVGGCRPLSMVDFLNPEEWEVRYREVTVAFGIPSEVVVAGNLTPGRRGPLR